MHPQRLGFHFLRATPREHYSGNDAEIWGAEGQRICIPRLHQIPPKTGLPKTE